MARGPAAGGSVAIGRSPRRFGVILFAACVVVAEGCSSATWTAIGNGLAAANGHNATVEPFVIRAWIDGTFEGFQPGRMYRLTNGQIWEQTSYEYWYSYRFRPSVLIVESGGVLKMQVEGDGPWITVRRVA